jgi:Ca2+-binding EF-hand superfamily protein
MKHTMMAAALAFAMTGCTAEISPPAPSAEGRVALGALPERTRAYLSVADANQDGVLVTDELAQHYAARTRAVFQRLDQNGDGKLELSELPVALRHTLAAADRDGDGAISSDEFVGHHNARLLARLRRADANGDGALEPDEVGPLRWARLQAADADHDGKVTFAELRRAFGYKRSALSQR